MNNKKFLIVLLLFVGSSLLSIAQGKTHHRLHAEGERMGMYQASDTTKSKRVLLIGGSILGGHLAEVLKALKDKVVIDYWMTPVNEGSPELFSSIQRVMSHGAYDVIHFMARGDMFHWTPEGVHLQREAVIEIIKKSLSM